LSLWLAFFFRAETTTTTTTITTITTKIATKIPTIMPTLSLGEEEGDGDGEGDGEEEDGDEEDGDEEDGDEEGGDEEGDEEGDEDGEEEGGEAGDGVVPVVSRTILPGVVVLGAEKSMTYGGRARGRGVAAPPPTGNWTNSDWFCRPDRKEMQPYLGTLRVTVCAGPIVPVFKGIEQSLSAVLAFNQKRMEPVGLEFVTPYGTPGRTTKEMRPESEDSTFTANVPTFTMPGVAG
jgi:hypothetical protein